MEGKVLSFGELLLRVGPDASGRWLSEQRLPFYVGGAELNVASALALWQIPTAYFTALPDNSLSRQVAGYVASLGVDTSHLHYGGERLGLYYLYQGKDLKHEGVIYDRKYSSFSTLTSEDIDWDALFEGVDWFHFSAISPALSRATADLCLEAVKQAHNRRVKVSVDLNYRAQLWAGELKPVDVMPALISYCQVVMGNVWSLETMLGIPLGTGFAGRMPHEAYLEQAERSSRVLLQRFSNCQAVANTFRFHQQAGITYYSTLLTKDGMEVSGTYKAESAPSKVGSGDCYMAGLIYGLLQRHAPREVVSFASAAGFTKLFVESDATNMTVDQIKMNAAAYEQ